ncbi:hypothetical protein CROQUDRAFT_86256 [Cronartium quercuum f. sp. fusiforme G11]|uniref:Transmembrane protein n=1 Tax=Cronartium quercuum f. sp. fusiforme G11 TaxID=708437 RepID=A0A9P6NTN1_9BASI|nr:hypothetical protein CROQUDRAFT_86256 [Cronartium quercuum f. sp. fusiforme G11]
MQARPCPPGASFKRLPIVYMILLLHLYVPHCSSRPLFSGLLSTSRGLGTATSGFKTGTSTLPKISKAATGMSKTGAEVGKSTGSSLRGAGNVKSAVRGNQVLKGKGGVGDLAAKLSEDGAAKAAKKKVTQTKMKTRLTRLIRGLERKFKLAIARLKVLQAKLRTKMPGQKTTLGNKLSNHAKVRLAQFNVAKQKTLNEVAQFVEQNGPKIKEIFGSARSSKEAKTSRVAPTPGP